MRRLEVRLTPSALGDLGNLFQFIHSSGSGDSIAERFVSRLLAACDGIGDAPWSGRSRGDLGPGLRTRSFERRVLIVYRVEHDLVLVAGLLYIGCDVDAHYARLRDPSDMT